MLQLKRDGTSGFVSEVFDDSDELGADVVVHGYPQTCMPNPVEGLLEVYEDIGEGCFFCVVRHGRSLPMSSH